jgi:hypothetical protein
MLELRNVSKRMTMTIALNKLKSFSFDLCSLAVFFVNVFIEDVFYSNSNTMPVMVLQHKGKKKINFVEKKEGF